MGQTSNSINETLEILEKVDSFYRSSWDNLVLAGSITLGILGIVFGIIMPFVINWLQNRKLNIEKNELKKDIMLEYEKLKNDLKEEIRKEYQEELKLLRETILKERRISEGAILHTNGVSASYQRDFITTATCFYEALKRYLMGDDMVNFNTINKGLIDFCLPQIKKYELEEVFKKRGETIEDYFKSLNALANGNDLVISNLNQLRYATDNVK